MIEPWLTLLRVCEDKHKTISKLIMSKIEVWECLIAACRSHHIAPEIIIRPNEYREHRQATARAIVLREMAGQRIPLNNLRVICPLSDRTLKRLTETMQ